MQDLLNAQRIGGRRVKAARSRRQSVHTQFHRRRGAVRQESFFRPGYARPILLSAPSALTGFVRNLFRHNRYLFVTTCSLVFLAATGLVFSVILQQSLAPSSVLTRATAQAAEPDVGVQALSDAYRELGAGTPAGVRDRDVEYVLQEGDSLYSLGKLYVMTPQDLQEFNRISDPNRLRTGATIVIPSKANLASFLRDRSAARTAAREERAATAPASLLPAGIAISARTSPDGPLVKAELRVETALPDRDVFYQWDLGDGSVSHAAAVTASYVTPGTYRVNLTVRDKFGYEVKSNTVSLAVNPPAAAEVSRTMFVTVNAVGDTFTLPGKVAQVDDFLGRTDKPIQFVEERDGNCFYRALVPGNYALIARGANAVTKVYLFVSPFPSVQNDRFDVDWYRTQYNTGSSNCGPASVSMAVGWAKGDYVSVTAVRNYLGFQGDGGTSFPQLENALQWRGVKERAVDIAGLDDVFAVIDRGDIAIILFHTARISKVRGRADADYVGRYYADSVGHYVIVKGYTKDKKYFVVYDPLPSDWSSNGTRYGDGLSMIGRNRYYSVAEMGRALSLPRMLVVSR